MNQIIDVCKTVYNYPLKEGKDWLSFGDRLHETSKVTNQ
ncbi:MAG: hypothetical protein F6K18_27180 [Okeania sp. SIO2C2]|nr:hypothetical protein [Okeania sp. SIO2C2]